MANVHMSPEWTDRDEYETHLRNYRRFIRLLWWSVAGVAVALALLAIFFT